MELKEIQKLNIDKALKILSNEIGGEWILLGGALALFEFSSQRATHDIDIVPKVPNPMERSKLFDVAEKLHLPIEAINSAADFFLKKFLGWEDHLVLIIQGPKGTIYRPDLTLYFALKLSRGTEADIQDCNQALLTLSKHELQRDVLTQWLKGKKIPLRAKNFLRKNV